MDEGRLISMISRRDGEDATPPRNRDRVPFYFWLNRLGRVLARASYAPMDSSKRTITRSQY